MGQKLLSNIVSLIDINCVTKVRSFCSDERDYCSNEKLIALLLSYPNRLSCKSPLVTRPNGVHRELA